MFKFKRMYQSLVVAIMALMLPVVAMAEPSGLTLPTTVDLSGLFPYAAAIVAALVGLIVIRKAIKLTNRT